MDISSVRDICWGKKQVKSKKLKGKTMDPMGLLIVAAGLFSAGGGILDWEWFMNNRKARFLSSILTRTGARIFYVVLGLGLVVLGTLMTLRVVQ